MESMLNYLKIPVIASSGIAAVLSGVLYFKQNELIYPRNIPLGSRTSVPKPNQFGITDYEELMIPTPDGESLNAFFIRPSNKARSRNVTILMFHGNAGNIGYRLPIAKVLEEDLGCNVLMLQYRGYGLSTGTPNEKGLTIDAQTGLDYIRERAELSNTKIVVYGQSLGGAVSIGLVARNLEKKDIAGLILENTFLSIRKLIPSAFPPARFLAPLCHQIWPSDEMLPRITDVPILFLSGEKDEIVPVSHMTQLYNICKAKRKVIHTFPNGTHNDTVAEAGYFDYMEDFINTYIAGRNPLGYRRRTSRQQFSVMCRDIYEYMRAKDDEIAEQRWQARLARDCPDSLRARIVGGWDWLFPPESCVHTRDHLARLFRRPQRPESNETEKLETLEDLEQTEDPREDVASFNALVGSWVETGSWPKDDVPDEGTGHDGAAEHATAAHAPLNKCTSKHTARCLPKRIICKGKGKLKASFGSAGHTVNTLLKRRQKE